MVVGKLMVIGKRAHERLRELAKSIVPKRARVLETPAKIAMLAGLATVLYGPVMAIQSGREHIGALIAWPTVIAVAMTVLASLQIQCMITGGCPFAAWTGAVWLAVTCTLYIVYVTRALRRAKDDEDLPKTYVPSYQLNPETLSRSVETVKTLLPRDDKQVQQPRPSLFPV